MKTSRHNVAAALVRRPITVADATEIAAYLLTERRTGELNSLLRDIKQLRADAGVVEVTAVSAFPLSDAVVADVERQVRSMYPSASRIIISPRHDESIVGGVKLEFANQQLDLTVKSTLNRLKQLTTNPTASQSNGTKKGI